MAKKFFADQNFHGLTIAKSHVQWCFSGKCSHDGSDGAWIQC